MKSGMPMEDGGDIYYLLTLRKSENSGCLARCWLSN